MLRQAVPDDASHIRAIKQAVWTDETSELTQIRRAISSENHAAFVVEVDEQVVGFVDGFMTLAHDGTKRWEVDLLAVHPSWQGQGIGKSLLEAITLAGKKRGAMLLRGLVQVDNVASYTAFQRMGYHSDGKTYSLCISTEPSDMFLNDQPDGLHIVPVETLSYRGIWIENNFTEEALRYCQHLLTQFPYDVVGALIPTEWEGIHATAQNLKFTQINTYRWWMHTDHTTL